MPKKAVLSTVPGTSNSRARRIGLPAWRDSSRARLLGALVEQPGGLEQDGGALDRGGPAPLLEGGAGGRDRGVDVGVPREGHRLDGLVGARVEDVEGLARGRRRAVPRRCTGAWARAYAPARTPEKGRPRTRQSAAAVRNPRGRSVAPAGIRYRGVRNSPARSREGRIGPDSTEALLRGTATGRRPPQWSTPRACPVRPQPDPGRGVGVSRSPRA